MPPDPFPGGNAVLELRRGTTGSYTEVTDRNGHRNLQFGEPEDTQQRPDSDGALITIHLGTYRAFVLLGSEDTQEIHELFNFLEGHQRVYTGLLYPEGKTTSKPQLGFRAICKLGWTVSQQGRYYTVRLRGDGRFTRGTVS